MIEHVAISIFEVLSGGLCGYLLGVVYFQHLWRAVENFSKPGVELRFVFGALLRIAIAVAVFAALMQWSVLAVISGLVCFSLARSRYAATKVLP